MRSTRPGTLLLLAALSASAQSWPTFFSAYEDGLAAQAQGDHARAAQAFQRAIALNPKPGRNVRTYGLNFLPVYAPYLRLAESRLALGDLAGAGTALDQSEAQGAEPAAERQVLRARVETLRRQATVPAPAGGTPAQALPSAPAPVLAAPPPAAPPPVALGAGAGSASPPAAPARDPRRGGTEPRSPGPAEPPTAPANPPAPEVSAHPPAAAPVSPAPAPAPAPGPRRGIWALGATLAALAGLGGGLVLRRRARPMPVPPGEAPASAAGLETLRLARPAPPSRDPNLGRAFGRYVAERVLGRGGCATAYFGMDPETGEEVAIKVPHPHLLDQGDFQARFHREAELGILLAHPRIVPLLDSSPGDDDPWLVTRFIPGETLSSHLHLHGPLGIPQSVAIASDIADAIHFAHQRGVVHRDLKPANVMVTTEGAMVMDFGIARVADGALTATTMFLGTPLYCAPESVVSSKVGPPADWYALGIMLFEMLTGQVPFQAESSFQILESHRTRPLPDLRAIRPMTPPPLEDLVRRLCAKAPDTRPTGAEILDALSRLRELYPPTWHAADAGS